ncbi:hypothetical protein PMAYCL1PPCAC_23055, partial [Pristionchus mayeri]
PPPPPPPPVGGSYAQAPSFGGIGGPLGGAGGYAAPSAPVFGGASAGDSYAAPVSSYGAQASQGASYAQGPAAAVGGYAGSQGAGGNYAQGPAAAIGGGSSYAQGPAAVGGFTGVQNTQGGSYAAAVSAPATNFESSQGAYAAGPAVGAGGAYAAPVAAPQTVVTEVVQTSQVGAGAAIVQPQISIDAPAPQLPAYQEKAPIQQNVQTIPTETQQATVETQYEDDSAEQVVAPAQPAPTVEYKEQPAPAPAPVVEEPLPAVEPEQQVEEVHEEPAPVAVEPATAAPSHASAAEGDKKPDAEYTDYQADEETDEGNCDDAELRAIVEASLAGEKDNLEAARKIEGDASAKFGGRFNSIVSDAEFAYVNWYGKRNCQLRIENRHSLTWED